MFVNDANASALLHFLAMTHTHSVAVEAAPKVDVCSPAPLSFGLFFVG
jgi:hypothetical protein